MKFQKKLSEFTPGPDFSSPPAQKSSPQVPGRIFDTPCAPVVLPLCPGPPGCSYQSINIDIYLKCLCFHMYVSEMKKHKNIRKIHKNATPKGLEPSNWDTWGLHVGYIRSSHKRVFPPRQGSPHMTSWTSSRGPLHERVRMSERSAGAYCLCIFCNYLCISYIFCVLFLNIKL